MDGAVIGIRVRVSVSVRVRVTVTVRSRFMAGVEGKFGVAAGVRVRVGSGFGSVL